MSGFGKNEDTELEHNLYDYKHMEENCWVGQNPQGTLDPTEDNVTLEQRKNYK